jgi:hypothetical protein
MTAPETRFRTLADGEVIRLSRLRLALLLSACIVGICVFASAALRAPQQVPTSRRQLPSNPLFGILGALVWTAGAVMIVLPFLRDRRMVLGADRLQMVEGNRVRLEIPFDNIADAVVRKRARSEAVLMLRLHDPCRSDTRWDDPGGVRYFLKRSTGFDLFLETGFQDSPKTLRKKILERCLHLQPAQAAHPFE